MLVQKLCTSVHLLGVQVATPIEVNAGLGEFFLDDFRVAPGLVQIMDVGERRAHRCADEQ